MTILHRTALNCEIVRRFGHDCRVDTCDACNSPAPRDRRWLITPPPSRPPPGPLSPVVWQYTYPTIVHQPHLLAADRIIRRNHGDRTRWARARPQTEPNPEHPQLRVAPDRRHAEGPKPFNVHHTEVYDPSGQAADPESGSQGCWAQKRGWRAAGVTSEG